jgi:hypothetical protein
LTLAVAYTNSLVRNDSIPLKELFRKTSILETEIASQIPYSPLTAYFVYDIVKRSCDRYRAAPDIEWQPGVLSDKHVQFCIQPLTLIAALWIDFAQAISGVSDVKECKRRDCGELFVIGGRFGLVANVTFAVIIAGRETLI